MHLTYCLPKARRALILTAVGAGGPQGHPKPVPPQGLFRVPLGFGGEMEKVGRDRSPQRG